MIADVEDSLNKVGHKFEEFSGKIIKMETSGKSLAIIANSDGFISGVPFLENDDDEFYELQHDHIKFYDSQN